MNGLAETSDYIHSLTCFNLLSTVARRRTSDIFVNPGLQKHSHLVIFSP